MLTHTNKDLILMNMFSIIRLVLIMNIWSLKQEQTDMYSEI